MSEKNKKGASELTKDLELKVEEEKRAFDGAYILNPENYQRFVKVYAYFLDLAESNEGTVSRLDIKPTSIRAGISIEVPIVELLRDSIREFTDILSDVDVFNVTAGASDSLLIDASVNDVWKAVSKE